MTKIVLHDIDASRAMEIVKELRSSGLVQGEDFDFRYKPSEDNNFTYEDVIRKHTVFVFYKEKYATLFALKYAS
jgi:hypothetical protein